MRAGAECSQYLLLQSFGFTFNVQCAYSVSESCIFLGVENLYRGPPRSELGQGQREIPARSSDAMEHRSVL